MFWTEGEDGVGEGEEGLGGGGQDPLPGGQEIRLPVVINGGADGGGLEALGGLPHTKRPTFQPRLRGTYLLVLWNQKCDLLICLKLAMGNFSFNHLRFTRFSLANENLLFFSISESAEGDGMCSCSSHPVPCFFTPLKPLIRNRKIRHFNVETNEWEDLSRESDSFNQLVGESEATGSRLSRSVAFSTRLTIQPRYIQTSATRTAVAQQ